MILKRKEEEEKKMSDEDYSDSSESDESNGGDSDEYSDEELDDEELEMLEEEIRENERKRKIELEQINSSNSNKKNKRDFDDMFKFIIINMSNPLPMSPLLNLSNCSNLSNDPNSLEENSSTEGQDEQQIKFGPELPIDKIHVPLKFDKVFETLSELITLGETYDPSIAYDCNLNMHKLYRIVEPMKELNNMIGLEKFKKSIIDQIVYLLTINLTTEKPMLHTCIYGPPGCGKSQISTILAKIYSSCGVLSGNKFRVVKREDFVAGYLGQTAIKTKKLLESMLGGVLFLDEAYSMGSVENRDYFAKEAIDTLNVFLSENYANFILIIAGYEDDIKQCFFAQNSGLERRFPYRFTIEGYSPKELNCIFRNFVKAENWQLSDELFLYCETLFTKHKDSFPFYGGDVKTFFDKCKIIHTKKLIMLEKSLWKILTKKDIKDAFALYLQERPIKKDTSPLHMYI